FVNKLVAQKKIENKKLTIEFVTDSKALWLYKIKSNRANLPILPPSFEVDGKKVLCNLKNVSLTSAPTVLRNGVTEYVYQGTVVSQPDLKLSVYFQISPDNAIVRYKYALQGNNKNKLTKSSGTDNIIYSATSFSPFSNVKELQVSNYDERIHSYRFKEQVIEDRFIDNNYSAMGPIMVAGNTDNSFLLAYEHGSHYGNEFLHFNFSKDRSVSISAVKGNYYNNRSIAKGSEYETVWFEMGGIKGNEDALAAEYRNFVLKYLSQNLESRAPYIYYNTWGRQERSKEKGKTYLHTMNLTQTLEEIEKAKAMGVDVFVLDVGWFTKTGDWELNTSKNFFPDTLSQVKALLKKYNMKLGLWFNPTLAGVTSRIAKKNAANRTSLNGNLQKPYPSWETEASYSMCLASSFYIDFSNELIRLIKEHNVCYFKWDAIWQGDCDAPGHFHGTDENTMQDRRDNDAYLQPIYMAKIVEKVSTLYPNTIFDFDITEQGRSMGLSFLAVGKYFAINNGPYFRTYDLGKMPDSIGSNIFTHPGPARGWIARSILNYDRWIPSILFLTHYLPDEPRSSQMLNVASLILGQNGIWGEILKTSPEGTKLFGDVLDKYKQVKYDITAAPPTSYGTPGDLVEIHEKINPVNGKGAVVVFGIKRIEVTYITKEKVNPKFWNTEGVSIGLDAKGRAIIKATFSETGAKIIYFGVE
ncbi:MAG: alpha-galactosidase, partial [Bacteroidota bacterium]